MLNDTAVGRIDKERVCESWRCEESSMSRFEQALRPFKVILNLKFESIGHLTNTELIGYKHNNYWTRLAMCSNCASNEGQF